MESASFHLVPVPSVVGCDTDSIPDFFGDIAMENVVQPLCPGNRDVVGCQMP